MLGDERVRFLAIGAVNTVVGYSFFVLVQWSVGHAISYFGSLLIAHLLSSILAFALYRAVVFRVRGRVLIDFLRFQTVYVVPLAANALALPVLVSVLHWNVYASQALIVIVSTIISFFGHKYFSFRRRAVEAHPLTSDASDATVRGQD
ncbi:MAG: GtrA family protein [Lacisediminihabitans sp.]